MRALHHHYKPWGLSIYGVHESALSFAREAGYLSLAARRLGLRWPQALDEPEVRWPASPTSDPRGGVLLDPRGAVRAEISGSGSDYTQFEMELRRIWREIDPDIDLPAPLKREELAVDTEGESDLQPVHAADATVTETGGARTAPAPAGPPPKCELVGTWEPRADGLIHLGAQGEIRLTGCTAPVYAVLGTEASAAGEAPITVEVETRRDAADRIPQGTDVHRKDDGAALRVGAPRLYHVLRESAAPPNALVLRTHREGLTFYAWVFGACLDPEIPPPS